MNTIPQDLLLENKFVLLRPLQECDIENLLPFAIHEPELYKFNSVSGDGPENIKKKLLQYS